MTIIADSYCIWLLFSLLARGYVCIMLEYMKKNIQKEGNLLALNIVRPEMPNKCISKIAQAISRPCGGIHICILAHGGCKIALRWGDRVSPCTFYHHILSSRDATIKRSVVFLYGFSQRKGRPAFHACGAGCATARFVIAGTAALRGLTRRWYARIGLPGAQPCTD